MGFLLSGSLQTQDLSLLFSEILLATSCCQALINFQDLALMPNVLKPDLALAASKEISVRTFISINLLPTPFTNSQLSVPRP